VGLCNSAEAVQDISRQSYNPLITGGSIKQIWPTDVASAENGGVPTRRVPSRIAVLDMTANRFDDRAPKNHEGPGRFSIQLYPIAFLRDKAGDAISGLQGRAA